MSALRAHFSRGREKCGLGLPPAAARLHPAAAVLFSRLRRLASSCRRTQYFQRAQAGRGPGFDPELREDFQNALFYGGFAVAENGCNLAVCLSLGQPEQCFGYTRG